MQQKQKLYIIPGWGETVRKKEYREIISLAQKKYSIVPVIYSFDTKKSFSDNLKEVKNQIDVPCAKDVIFGFSHGALLAYQLAGIWKFKRAIICSISAILEGDLSKYPKDEVAKIFTPTQVVALHTTKYRKPKSETVLFYGAKETKQVRERSILLKKKYDTCTLVAVPNTDHQLTKKYRNEILKILMK